MSVLGGGAPEAEPEGSVNRRRPRSQAGLGPGGAEGGRASPVPVGVHRDCTF